MICESSRRRVQFAFQKHRSHQKRNRINWGECCWILASPALRLHKHTSRREFDDENLKNSRLKWYWLREVGKMAKSISKALGIAGFLANRRVLNPGTNKSCTIKKCFLPARRRFVSCSRYCANFEEISECLLAAEVDDELCSPYFLFLSAPFLRANSRSSERQGLRVARRLLMVWHE